MVLGKEVKVSICIPCMNRVYDLKQTMPHLINAANASPPVEIAVLDYNSKDKLRQYMNGIIKTADLNEVSIIYTRYEGRDHYHMAHAYNLAAMSSSGGYIIIMGADAVPSEEYVVGVRKLIARGTIWMRGPYYKGILACERQEFINAGGYDERFEFYGGEDKDLELRLARRGSKFGLVPNGLISTLRTGNRAKVKNYRLPLTKREMMVRGRKIRDENNSVGLLVANEGIAWGKP